MSTNVLIGLVVGVVGGMVVGAMPGLSGAMAIALLLPVTYSMSPIAALVMLMAIYTSAAGWKRSVCQCYRPVSAASSAPWRFY